MEKREEGDTSIEEERGQHVDMKDYGKKVNQEEEKSRDECWSDLGLITLQKESPLDPLVERGGAGLVLMWAKIMDLGMRWEKV